ncbi:MAG: P1 family peptidase [Acidobacteria bacterium]|nr:P1 family peptidase [Acidobacteriota bacterium]
MPTPRQPGNATLTAVPGIAVGHCTLAERPTGCTVVLTGRGATAGVDVRGAAPATRETDLLGAVNVVQQVHAIVLSGGSAYGLDAAAGVMRFLEERGVGFAFGGVRVPIVPGAALFDLAIGDPRVRPSAEHGYRAAAAASGAPVAEGSVGAGAGATFGKLAGVERAMKGGLGSAAIVLADGLIVAALAAVNAAGDVVDPATGAIVAGARAADGAGFADARRLVRAGAPGLAGRQPGAHTTLGVVATNAALDRPAATRVAQMAHDGLARAICPSHTSSDGDTIFALATGARAGADDASRIGALAADAMAEAILRAVREASGVPGFPALRDLRP